jgi:NAD(P)-dependent dehydrogenase (short-subunit alcohol dehydrogenase family)
VSIAGRSETRAKSVLWEANLAHPGPLGKFYKVDLSSMKEVERFTDEVAKDVAQRGGIDYLILSAGGPPVGRWRQGPDVRTLSLAIDIDG